MSEEPASKKRRTQRACAACRRRKIKCNAEQPCSACEFNKLACSYDEDNRRLNAPEYIQALEKKVEELETLLANLKSSDDRKSEGPLTNKSESLEQSLDTNPRSKSPEDDVLETIFEAEDRPFTRRAEPERYWGNFSGLSLLKRMRGLCSEVAGLHRDSDGDAVEDDFIHAFDCPSPTDSPPVGSWEAFALLPSKERLLECVDIAIDEATCLMRFLNRQEVDKVIDRIYDTDTFEYSASDRKQLALVYALLALGRRFEMDKDKESPDSRIARKGLAKGLRYFRASRSMLDVADCHDLISLQTVLCMVIYLQASSMMSTCYSYISAAVAAALRMGLHTSSASEGLPEIERQTRRRIYSVLNVMDTYVTTAMGLPKTLRDVISDQELPIEEKDGGSESVDPISPIASMQAHAKLIIILANTVELIHPATKPVYQKNGYYGVEYRNIVAIEDELEKWDRELPHNIDSNNTKLIRAQLLLRLKSAHVQMVLYRPFLHHATKDLRPSKEIRYKSYACGSACVKAAMQAVWLAEALEARGLFNEAYWFVALIVSFAATILFLFCVRNGNDKDDTVQETADAAERANKLLSKYADRSASARRFSKFLQELSDARKLGNQHLGDKYSNDGNDLYYASSSSHNGTIARHHSSSTSFSDEDQGQMLQAMSYPRLHPYLDEY